MTKKDLELIVQAVVGCHPNALTGNVKGYDDKVMHIGRVHMYKTMLKALMLVMAESNPRFNHRKFRQYFERQLIEFHSNEMHRDLAQALNREIPEEWKVDLT